MQEQSNPSSRLRSLLWSERLFHDLDEAPVNLCVLAYRGAGLGPMPLRRTEDYRLELLQEQGKDIIKHTRGTETCKL